ncbi:MAG: methyltransferase domain-containing protein [Saprospiraceae bacterium]|nr:methyltransferase domain-containing protein [Lewinella sp.]
MKEKTYIHGVAPEEQDRLRLLNRLTNGPYLDFVKIKPGDQVLEIGSGLGIIAHAIAETYPSAQVTGLEYAAEQIAGSPQDLENLTFRQGDAHHIPFADASLDVVYGRYILEHVHDPSQVLREVYRVLKPGGRVYFQENTISIMKLYPECPQFDFIWKQFIALQARIGGDGEIGVKMYHMLKSVGFGGLQCSFADEVHYPEKGTFVAWMDNIIGNVESAVDKLLAFGLATEEQISGALAELTAFKQDDMASVYFWWNRIAGVKPA